MARPLKYTEERRAEIIDCALQSLRTGQSLLAFCKENKLAYAMVWEWLNPDGLNDSSPYAMARRTGTHYMADECLEIADEIISLKRAMIDPALTEGEVITIRDRVAVAKLRIDTRLRLAGKWNKQYYGDKVAPETEAGDGEIRITGGLSDD